MLDSRSSACRIHDNDKVRDSTEVSNPPLFFVLYKALVGLLCKRENFVFGGFNIGCPLLTRKVVEDIYVSIENTGPLLDVSSYMIDRESKRVIYVKKRRL